MDARIRYTKMIIRQEFIKLLAKNNISKITVTAICNNAQINRASFYKYYDNPYDLLTKIEGELLDNLQQKIEALDKKSFPDVLKIVLEDLKENADTYIVIFSGNGDMNFRERIFFLCHRDNMDYINETYPGLDPVKKEWLYHFMLEGCNGIINSWIGQDMQVPIDDVVEFTSTIGRILHFNLKC